MSTKIYEVKTIALAFIKVQPPFWEVQAQGQTNRSGWTNPKLELISTRGDIRKGIYIFNFEATPPTGDVPQVLTPIHATYRLDENTFISKIIVHAQQNSSELNTDETEQNVDNQLTGTNFMKQVIVGTSIANSLQEAYDDAVKQLDIVGDRFFRIKVEEITGEQGGIAGVRKVFVKISAT